MSELTPREAELVAVGAALGSNCIPCVEYHVAESRKVGLTDAEIRAAIERAEKIRQIPAQRSLQAALGALGNVSQAAKEPVGAKPSVCGNAAVLPEASATVPTHPAESMMAMMSKMMAACGAQSSPAAASLSNESRPAVNPQTSGGCACG